MRTHYSNAHSVNSDFITRKECTSSPVTKATGLVSELIFNEEQPAMTHMLLLPLLQQLGTQARWQLWLTPNQKLSREWLKASGLPLDKVMQAQNSPMISNVEAMIKALKTGNYSVVLGWFTEVVTADERQRLDEAASQGQALGLIMRSEASQFANARPFGGLKIHSTLYH